MIDTARREGRITKSAGGTDQINRQTTYAQTLEEDTLRNIRMTEVLRADVERLEAQLRASNEYATNAVNEIRGNPQNISPSDDTVAGVAKKITTAMDNGGTGQVNVVIDAKDQSSTQIDSSTKSNIAPQRVEIAGGGSCGSSSNGLTPGGVMYG
jgi:3'-phosphoadenosine 5'-phosphosulfate sulfotransferase